MKVGHILTEEEEKVKSNQQGQFDFNVFNLFELIYGLKRMYEHR